MDIFENVELPLDALSDDDLLIIQRFKDDPLFGILKKIFAIRIVKARDIVFNSVPYNADIHRTLNGQVETMKYLLDLPENAKVIINARAMAAKLTSKPKS